MSSPGGWGAEPHRARLPIALVLLAAAALALIGLGPGAAPALACTGPGGDIRFSTPPRNSGGSGNLPTAVAGQAYHVTVQASGSVPPYHWSLLTNLPPGLSWSIVSSSGSNMDTLVLDGAISTPGDYSFSFGVSANGGGCNYPNAGWYIDTGPPTITSVSTSTCGGAVTIYGTELDGIDSPPSSVTFGGAAATVTGGWTDGETVFPVTLPPDAPVGVPIDVKVQTDAGTATYPGYVIPAQPASVTTGGATIRQSDASATLTGTVNPGCHGASYHFEYGPQNADGTYAYTLSTAPQSLPGGSTDVSVSAATVPGLRTGTTYHYRAVAGNGAGTALGADGQFTFARRVRVGSLSVSYSDLLARRLATLRSARGTLVTERNGIGRAITAVQDELRKDLETDSDLQRQTAVVERRLGDLKRLVDVIANDERGLPDALRRELRLREGLEETIGSVRDQLILAEESANGPRVKQLQKTLAHDEALAREQDGVLDGRLTAFDPTLRVERAKLRVAHRELFELLAERARSKSGITAHRRELVGLGRRQADIDGKLTDLARQLAATDIQLTRVTVYPGPADQTGVSPQAVFDAQLKTPALQLQEIAAQVDQVRQKIAELEVLHKQLSDDAKAANHELGVEDRELQRKLFYGRGADYMLNLSFDLIDVAQAQAEGGAKGIIFELLKKGADTLIKYELDEHSSSESGYPPGSLEDQINKEFNAGLKNSWSIPGFQRTAELRAIKEGARKPALDAAAWGLGALYKKLGAPISELEKAQTKRLAALPTSGVLDSLEKWIRVANRRDKILESLLKGPQIPEILPKGGSATKAFKGNLLVTLAKEVVKQFWKGRLEKQKANAWANYAMTYAIDVAATQIARRCSDLIEQAGRQQDALLQREQELLAAYDPTAFQTLKDDEFDLRSTVVVVLTFARHSDEPGWNPAEQIVFHARLAGQDAAAVGARTSGAPAGGATGTSGTEAQTFSAATLTAGPGGLGLDVRLQ